MNPVKLLYIPTIGAKLVLAQPWTFTVKNEYRNHSLWDALGLEHCPPGTDWVTRSNMITAATLPVGTELTVDRIYIRKGKHAYDSLTFWAKLPDVKKQSRFFAPLEDVNTMVVTD